MTNTRRRIVAAATVSLLAGASFFGTAGRAEAKPDPGVHGNHHLGGCMEGFIIEYWDDDGPLTDLLHHYVEVPLWAFGGETIHYALSCWLSNPRQSPRL